MRPSSNSAGAEPVGGVHAVRVQQSPILADSLLGWEY
jgi:hypothetical protein